MIKIKNELAKRLFANNHPISQHVSLRNTHNHIHHRCVWHENVLKKGRVGSRKEKREGERERQTRQRKEKLKERTKRVRLTRSISITCWLGRTWISRRMLLRRTHRSMKDDSSRRLGPVSANGAIRWIKEMPTSRWSCRLLWIMELALSVDGRDRLV